MAGERSLLLSLILSGCTFLTSAQIDRELDEDNDGVAIDDDCDPLDPQVRGREAWFVDRDGDGIGGLPGDEVCDPEAEGQVRVGGDCDDDDPHIWDEVQWFVDADGDGHGGTQLAAPSCDVVPPSNRAESATDCDDDDASVHPGAAEVCNDIDEDCDGLIGDDPDLPGEPAVYLPDLDGDGFGDATAVQSTPTQCPPAGHIALSGQLDCNDDDPAIKPGADEVCDFIDNNCNGTVDEELSFALYYFDTDEDGAPDPFMFANFCDTPPEPDHGQWLSAEGIHLAVDSDCNDLDASIHPAAVEHLYNGVDDDCNLSTSDTDADGDGFDAVAVGGADCDDHDASIHPAAEEHWYNAIDENCDGNLDDQDGDGDPVHMDCADTDPTIYSFAVEIWYNGTDENCDGNDTDRDGDGVPHPQDCNDGSPHIGPHVDEIYYDGIDQNCLPDDEYDQDGDGFTDPSGGGSDCNDQDEAINPAQIENTDQVGDEDCNPANDQDFDEDGSPVGVDCDDENPEVHPDRAEIWYDEIDQNCDGNDLDQDGDGFDSLHHGGTDCNDLNANIHPAASEIFTDAVDQNCSGSAGIVCGADGDGDGSAAPNTGVDVDALVCPIGTAAFTYGQTDCDDQDSSVYIGSLERCDGVDNDCDGYGDDAGISVEYAGSFSTLPLGTAYTLTDLDGATIHICTEQDGVTEVSLSFDSSDAQIQVHGPGSVSNPVADSLLRVYGGSQVTWDHLPLRAQQSFSPLIHVAGSLEVTGGSVYSDDDAPIFNNSFGRLQLHDLEVDTYGLLLQGNGETVLDNLDISSGGSIDAVGAVITATDLNLSANRDRPAFSVRSATLIVANSSLYGGGYAEMIHATQATVTLANVGMSPFFESSARGVFLDRSALVASNLFFSSYTATSVYAIESDVFLLNSRVDSQAEVMKLDGSALTASNSYLEAQGMWGTVLTAAYSAVELTNGAMLISTGPYGVLDLYQSTMESSGATLTRSTFEPLTPLIQIEGGDLTVGNSYVSDSCTNCASASTAFYIRNADVNVIGTTIQVGDTPMMNIAGTQNDVRLTCLENDIQTSGPIVLSGEGTQVLEACNTNTPTTFGSCVFSQGTGVATCQDYGCYCVY